MNGGVLLKLGDAELTHVLRVRDALHRRKLLLHIEARQKRMDLRRAGRLGRLAQCAWRGLAFPPMRE